MSTDIKAQNEKALASVKAIYDAAEHANDLLDDMEAAATAAHTTLTDIYQDASDAKTSADAAQDSAKAANRYLSEVENVVGTINWISKHGIYSACTEDTVQDNKIYYSITATAVTAPSGNPQASKYYELISGKYVLSQDTEVGSEKTYYKVTPAIVISPTGSPSANNYYELIVDEAVSQYVATHLLLTDAGLQVRNDADSGYILLSTSGVEIVNASGHVVGNYSENAVIGDELGTHISIVGSTITAWVGPENIPSNRAWYVANEMLYIPKVVVVDSMQAGNWKWDAATDPNHFTLRYSEFIGGE